MDLVLCSISIPHGDAIIGWEKDGKQMLPIQPEDLFGNMSKLDMANFKAITKGKNILMGRKTWETLGCKKLYDRKMHYILSRDTAKNSDEPAVIFLHDKEEAARIDDCMCIGGASLYEEFLYGDLRKYTEAVYWTQFTSPDALSYVEKMKSLGYTPIAIKGGTPKDYGYFNMQDGYPTVVRTFETTNKEIFDGSMTSSISLFMSKEKIIKCVRKACKKKLLIENCDKKLKSEK